MAVPAGHPVHAPEQAAVDRPAAPPNVPGGHSVQEGAPASEYVPGEHDEHTPVPPDANPAGHMAAAASVLPAAQLAHAPEQAEVARPAELPNVPAGQSLQVCCMVASE
jgi:hypothetical protein